MADALVLNPAQRKAVEHGEGPLLVIAGPGTGKTRVITQRIVHLVERRGVSPEAILALTFTDKAAQEMQRRVRDALPHPDKPPHISTFHAFCYHLLRERQMDRQLLDKVDVWIFLRQRMSDLGLDRYQKLAEPGAFLHGLNEFFSRCQDELIGPDDFEAYTWRLEGDFLRRATPTRAPVTAANAAALKLEEEEIARKKELARVFRASRQLIEVAGYSSFGTLISETLRLWEREPEVLERLRKHYRYVLVDEFQDTNFAQVELLRRLVAPPFNITAVGDDDQAIYRFRGASHGAFQMFDQRFPGHATVYLNTNYRSVKRILRAAGAVISRNDRYEAKPPFETGNPEGGPVFLVQSPDDASEAVWIAAEVDRLRAQGTRCGDVAVLYRGHGHRERTVEEFRRRGIPLNIRGLSILSSAIVRDLVAYLRLIHSPHHNVSLTRVLLAPRWRFREELAREIRYEASRARCSLYDAIRAREGTLFGGDLEQTGWEELHRTLQDLRKASTHLSMPALLDRLIERLDLAFLATDPDRAHVTAFRQFLEKWAQKNAGGAFAPAPGDGEGTDERRESPLRQFIEYFDYFVEAGGMIEAPNREPFSDAVQMMTVHAAKGLEFPIVLVLGIARHRFPHREQRPVIEFPDELRKGPLPPADIHLQEERRLFYVAMTRARERLYVSTVVAPQRKPSVFVDDLLRDPAVAARDIARLAASAATPAAEDQRLHPYSRSANPTREAGQGRLFQDPRGSGSPVRPDLNAWLSQSCRPADTGCDGRLVLSATAIETYRDCPLKFRFRHVMRIPTMPQATLTFGSVMHRTVRAYFELRKHGVPSFDEVDEFYVRAWKDVGFEDAYQAEAYKRAGREQLQRFVEQQNAKVIAADRMRFEQAFALDLGDVALEGRIDQVVPLEPFGGTGSPAMTSASPAEQQEVGQPEVELVDYKTGRPRSQKDADKSLQLSVYALGARRELKLNPLRLSFHNLANGETISTIRTSHDLERAEEDIRGVARQIEQEQFAPTPGFPCRRCDYVAICPAHEK